jgi:hypothetical protein
MFRHLTTAAACFLATAAHAAPTFIGTDFQSNRYNAMPADTLYVSVVYDGSGSAQLGIEFMCPNGPVLDTTPQLAGNINRVYTFAVDLDGCEPSGRFRVRGVRPNGVVDGLAFGLLWKDPAGDTHVLKSRDSQSGQNIVGLWPLGAFSYPHLVDTYASDLTDGFEAMRSSIIGAELVGNGRLFIRVL